MTLPVLPKDLFARVDMRALGGRVKPGHDKLVLLAAG
jgi:hypothetical protein